MMHGEGMYEEDNGAKYQGIFEEDYMLSSTHGSVMLPGIGMYEGELGDDKPNGKGKINFLQGGSYIGEVVDGHITGHGTLHYPNGHKYTGDLIDGKMHGKGTYEDEEGNKYVGLFEDDYMVERLA